MPIHLDPQSGFQSDSRFPIPSPPSPPFSRAPFFLTAAACGTRASRVHRIRNMQLAGSPVAANDRLAEAALCLESCASIWTRVYHPTMPELPVARPFWQGFCAQSRRVPKCDQCQIEVQSWMGATCYRLARAMSLAPIKSLDFSGSRSNLNARGRSDLSAQPQRRIMMDVQNA